MNSLSGGTSRRIALRNGELIPLTPEGQTLCQRERPPECRRPHKGGAERERGRAQVRAEKELHPRVMTDRSPTGPRGGLRVIPDGWLRYGHPSSPRGGGERGGGPVDDVEPETTIRHG